MSNIDYKLTANWHHKSIEFHVGDSVMIRVRPKQYPKNCVKKICARALGPFHVIRPLGSNAYLIDLPTHVDINPILKVKNLTLYLGTFEPRPLQVFLRENSCLRLLSYRNYKRLRLFLMNILFLLQMVVLTFI